MLLNGDWLHIRCVCHIINLVVTDGLKELSPSITAIRNAVRYVRSSPTRLRRFKEVAAGEQIESSALLNLDVPTRWNSTYLMLDAATKYQKAFTCLDEDLHYQSYFANSTDGPPTEKDWENAKVFGAFLRTFYELTLHFSGSLYLTSNRYLKDIVEAKQYLNKLSAIEDTLVCDMARSMKLKYDKYWGRSERLNRMLFIATVLDPRYKLEYVEHCVSYMFPNEGEARALVASVDDTLQKLFKEYVEDVDHTSSTTKSSISASLQSRRSSKNSTSSFFIGRSSLSLTDDVTAEFRNKNSKKVVD